MPTSTARKQAPFNPLADLAERLNHVTDRRNAAKRREDDAVEVGDFEAAYDALVEFHAMQQRGRLIESEILALQARH